MSKLFKLFVALFFTASVIAQTPQKISYQAVIRNGSNALVTNTQVGMQISILHGSSSGTAVFVETHKPTTNAIGLVSVEIGAGTFGKGYIANIDWASGPYFIKTETDPDGGTTYTITGTSQLLSVPYALHSKTAETVTGEITETQNLENVLTQNNSAGNKNITNLADPVNAQDAVTKAYVDAVWARLEALANSESILLANGLTDFRDGNHYNVVKIGNQIWLAENLKYLPSVVGLGTGSLTDPYYYVYGYNGTNVTEAKATSNYTSYGVLYNWPAAMNGSESSSANPSGVQGVCPTGWHLPSDVEWTDLINYLGDGSIAGNKLKEIGTTHWSSHNTGATNETGFTGLPGGYCSSLNTFNNIGLYGYFWSSTVDNSDFVWNRYLSYNQSYVIKFTQSKGNGLSVRCVRD